MLMTLPDREVVLWGVGHTNAHVLRMWRMQPIPAARLTCVSNVFSTTYSGMLPGVLAGQYARERMEIDLVRLCAAAEARLIRGNVTGLDLTARTLEFEDRPPLPFDVLSIGIGSVPSTDGVAGAGGGDVVTIKPMSTFLDRLEMQLRRVAELNVGRPLRLAVVGGGAGGVEIAFCVAPFASRVLIDVPVEVSLIDSGDQVAAGSRPGTNILVQERLADRGVEVLLGRRVSRVEAGSITLSDGGRIKADVVIWATGATAPPVLGSLGLPVDERGFLLTRPTLQTVADAPILVVGDSGTIADSPTPKAGVYAVRQGPILWRNIARILQGRELEPYRPQGAFLKILNTGDGRAIAEYRSFTFEGRWCRTLKDFIDGRFMDKYQDYRKMSEGRTAAPPMPAMRCTGCGGKIGGASLARVLQRLDLPAGVGVLVGLDAPDDAAVVQPPDGRPLALTVDFFAAPLEDAFLVGRLSALHAASDAYAMHARPLWALAMATVPYGQPHVQEQVLFEWLSGSLREFGRMGVSLVGGHTIEGPQFTVGYTVVAAPGPGTLRVKGGFRKDDRLVLTRPLGSGILLAAQARAMCRAVWMEALLETMLASNQEASSVLDEFNITGVTDVTGFGLAGHLLEALRASGLDAELSLDAVPLLPGVADMLQQGIESTLAPANRAAEAAIDASSDQRRTPAYSALFDPQTCGGLLLGVAEGDLPDVLHQLARTSAVAPAVIGRLREQRDSAPSIRIV